MSKMGNEMLFMHLWYASVQVQGVKEKMVCVAPSPSSLRLWRRRAELGVTVRPQAKNEAMPCFATYLLERQEQSGLSDDELAYLAGSMFGAGSDTVRLPFVFIRSWALTLV